MELGLLEALPEGPRRAVLAAGVRRRWRRGEVVFHEGDPGDTLHVVVAGRFAVRVSTPLGDAVTLAVSGPGQAFGEQALLQVGGHRTATVSALEAGSTIAFHRDRFEDLRQTEPAVDRFLVETLARQVRRLTGQVTEFLFVPADTRVLRRLAELCEGYDVDDGGPIDVPLTQEELATMAGTTRPTANRALQAAARAGHLQLRRGHVHVTDPAALADLAR